MIQGALANTACVILLNCYNIVMNSFELYHIENKKVTLKINSMRTLIFASCFSGGIHFW